MIIMMQSPCWLYLWLCHPPVSARMGTALFRKLGGDEDNTAAQHAGCAIQQPGAFAAGAESPLVQLIGHAAAVLDQIRRQDPVDLLFSHLVMIGAAFAGRGMIHSTHGDGFLFRSNFKQDY